MISIELRFPTGKFHATPWGRQVNEGAVEWPPSPWRLLRALLAVWHYKFPDVATDAMQSLMSQLAMVPPVYHLPPASKGHTRHFMPVVNDDRAKIFDTFVALSSESPLIVIWPHLELSEQQHELLSKLLSAMSYFGRAESWVDARVADRCEGEPNAYPLNGRDVRAGEELVRLLTPSEESSYSEWREETLTAMESTKLAEKQEKARQKGKSVEKEKLTSKELQLLQAVLPATLFDALHAETNEIRGAGWNRPPGSQWTDYIRSKDAFAPCSRIQKPFAKRLPKVARYAIASNVRPLLTDALFIGERVRTALMSKSRKQQQSLSKKDQETVHAASIFSGKNVDGVKRAAGHSHAHFLPEATTGDRRIRYLTVFAPEGFSSSDEFALSSLQRVWGDGGHDLQLVLIGRGQPGDFAGQNEELGQSPILDRSTIWKSRTPFVPTDHLKVRRSEMEDPALYVAARRRELERLIRKELARREWLKHYSESVQVEVQLDAASLAHWRKFRRSRDKGRGSRSSTTGYGIRLAFPEAVQGPIALGYGCHFGLGQFVPDNI